MDNTAIARIASPDLGPLALELLARYGDNDDVVFFLGRLVWQGGMAECLPPLLDIALDATRGRYARIASIRAVMKVGTPEQRETLWAAVARSPGPLDRAILSELIDGSPPTLHSVDLLLQTIERLEPHKRFEVTGLERSMHEFVDLLPMMTDDAPEQPLAHLVEGLHAYLVREPHIERGQCFISEAFAWLMSPALHAVDRLVAAKSVQALEPSAIATMRNVPALRFWRNDRLSEYQSALADNIPKWRELNDRLYWSSVVEAREGIAAKNDERLVDDWAVAYVGLFWRFGPEDFSRLAGWVRDRPDMDDRLVALSTALRVFVEADRPEPWLTQLRAAVEGDRELEETLEARTDPTPSPAMQKMVEDETVWRQERETEDAKEEKTRADWVRALKANPDRILHPVGLEPGTFTGDHLHLLQIALGSEARNDRNGGSAWQALIPEFGGKVAQAYRDAAIAHWRIYVPGLRSEGADTATVPYSLVFAMAGLAIEAGEESSFPRELSPAEVERALRYITWELNGFPEWFEALYRAHPEPGFEAVRKELEWELGDTTTDNRVFHILHDIRYHAPWLHAEVAPYALAWLKDHQILNSDSLRYSLSILTSGGIEPQALAALAKAQLDGGVPREFRPHWFAQWVDTAPTPAIAALEAELDSLPRDEAKAFAEEFINGLVGDRHGSGGSRTRAYRTAASLKALYVLMYRHIRRAEDINRASGVGYSPTPRDDAQEARDSLLATLASLEGPEAYAALRELEVDHPETGSRQWMGLRAKERAIVDADEPLWTVDQFAALAKGIVTGG